MGLRILRSSNSSSNPQTEENTTGFSIEAESGKDYDLDEISRNKDRLDPTVPLVIENIQRGESIKGKENLGRVAIYKEIDGRIQSSINDYKNYLINNGCNEPSIPDNTAPKLTGIRPVIIVENGTEDSSLPGQVPHNEDPYAHPYLRERLEHTMPGDLSLLDDFPANSSDESAYIYIDDNGSQKKISIKDLFKRKIYTAANLNSLLRNYAEGDLVFLEIEDEEE